MKLNGRIILSAVLATGGLLSLATVAVAEEGTAVAEAPAVVPATFISDGSVLKFDQDRASLNPIAGWQVEPRGAGMSVVMKEVAKEDPSAAKDYSQPLFSRNISVMTLNEASPIDEKRAESFKADFLKMATKDGAMKDLQFNSHKFFNYKGENDGLVLFAQHTSNGFQMMQMIILVSGEHKQYLLTYTDLASRFATPETYDAAWKSMTSIMVEGVAPVRYVREAKLGGSILAGLLLMIAPVFIARLASQRRMRKMVDSLQEEWDTGRVSTADQEDDLSLYTNVSRLDTTRVASSTIKGKKAEKKATTFDLDVSMVSSLGDDMLSTRKSRFASSHV